MLTVEVADSCCRRIARLVLHNGKQRTALFIHSVFVASLLVVVR